MISNIDKHCFYASYVYFLVLAFTIGIKSDQVQDNTVYVAFSDITIADWNNDGKTTKFKNIMASVVNGYCSSNFDRCSLQFWNTTRVFKNSDIQISSGFPKQRKDGVEIHCYILLPIGNNLRKNGTTVLPKQALDNILQANSTHISTAVGALVKNAAVDGTVKPSADNRLDYIMIPVSFGFLLLVILIACCLHLCHKRKIKESKRAERRQRALQKKAQSTNQIQNHTAPKEIPQVVVKPQRRKKSKIHNEGVGNGQARHQKDVVTLENEVRVREVKHDHAGDQVDCQVNNGYVGDVEENNESPVEGAANSVHMYVQQHIKSRHEKEAPSLTHEIYNPEDTSDDDDRIIKVESDVSSRLPLPRKLPPLAPTCPGGNYQ